MVSEHSKPPAAARFPWAPPAAVVLVAVGMLAWTWGGWADPVVDFGREVYVPWRLSEGEHLYGDLPYQYGPLSPYVNALCFVAGDTWWALLGLNLFVIGALTLTLYQLASRLGGRGGALAVGLLIVTLFAFAQLGPLGSFNFMAPYSHAATHGTLLACLTLAGVAGYLRDPRVSWAAAAGVGVGLCFLTKPEPFLGAGMAVTVGVGLCWWRERATRGRMLREGGALAGGVLVPPLFAWGLLMLVLPVDVAWSGMLGSWGHAENEPLRELVTGSFYAVGAGFDAPFRRLLTLLAWSLGYAAVLAPWVWLAWRLPPSSTRTRQVAFLAALVIAVVGVLAGALLRGPGWATPLPLAVLALTLFEVRRLRRLGDPTASPATTLRAAWGALALGFLLKMALNARLSDYGFTLALPGCAFVAAALVGWWPARLNRVGRAGGVLRAAAWSLGVVLVIQQLAVMRGHVAAKTQLLGVRPEERLWVDARGKALQEGLDELSLRVRQDERLLVLPEGVLLNFLLRRRVAGRGVTYVPTTVLLLGGQGEILEDLRADPPDYVLYVHRDTAEYGAELRYFGRDYARLIDAWIREHYEARLQVGAEPFAGDAFGVLLWERRG